MLVLSFQISAQIHCYPLLQKRLQDVNLKLQGVYALFSCIHTCWAIVLRGVSLSKKQSWAFTGRHFYNGCHLFWRLTLFMWPSGTAEGIGPIPEWKRRPVPPQAAPRGDSRWVCVRKGTQQLSDRITGGFSDSNDQNRVFLCLFLECHFCQLQNSLYKKMFPVVYLESVSLYFHSS